MKCMCNTRVVEMKYVFHFYTTLTTQWRLPTVNASNISQQLKHMSRLICAIIRMHWQHSTSPFSLSKIFILWPLNYMTCKQHRCRISSCPCLHSRRGRINQSIHQSILPIFCSIKFILPLLLVFLYNTQGYFQFSLQCHSSFKDCFT